MPLRPFHHQRNYNLSRKARRYYRVDYSCLADFNWQIPQMLINDKLIILADANEQQTGNTYDYLMED